MARLWAELVGPALNLELAHDLVVVPKRGDVSANLVKGRFGQVKADQQIDRVSSHPRIAGLIDEEELLRDVHGQLAQRC